MSNHNYIYLYYLTIFINTIGKDLVQTFMACNSLAMLTDMYDKMKIALVKTKVFNVRKKIQAKLKKLCAI